MKVRLFRVTLIYTAVILAITAYFYFKNSENKIKEKSSEYVVALNEIEHLGESGQTEQLRLKTEELQNEISKREIYQSNGRHIWMMSGVCLIFMIFITIYIYCSVLRPFEKMEYFAQEISKGNFDVPLKYERSNYFGKFTWAFDSMRREITKARIGEREAIENNKTVIATLSHDIKTPIASIRAYAEGLEANLDVSPERREKYLSVMIRKCDEVSKLTNDLFLHSLSDMDKLKVNVEKFELCGFMKELFVENIADHSEYNEHIRWQVPDFELHIMADRERLTQVVWNLISNAEKYAKSEIEVSVEGQGEEAVIKVRDYGTGIPDEDMPFIFEKFYRGKNCGNEQGSGLGLYIVKYITEKMGGRVVLNNHSSGLEAQIRFKIEN